MILLVILLLLLLFLCWLLFSTIECSIDTRIPQLIIRWRTIGGAMLVFENDAYIIRIKVPFFKREWNLEKLILQERKKPAAPKKKKKTSPAKRPPFKKIINVIKTFSIRQFEWAYGSDDFIKDAWLYALNFHPAAKQHVHINFTGENYLLLKIRNAPWRIIYAWIR
jgi:hypothetical protein